MVAFCEEKVLTPLARSALWCKEVAPWLGISAFSIAAIVVERMGSQVVNTSGGRLATITRAQSLGLFRATIGKQTGLMFIQCACTRELRLALETVLPSPALSVVLAAAICGVFPPAASR
eukprot:TRINITY_DN7942_c0_g1_i1.p2 TRINITY_DN7942_c0_g1~~TRINITY_DN7942_c0_g1_i1.p2  ORF type:complete len:119 (+),score=14.75 TRINITY_DN7942_c0_g1_i1:199-555(+)